MMAEAAVVPVDEAEHVEGYGESGMRHAHESAFHTSPHEVSEGGGEGGVRGVCPPEPGALESAMATDAGESSSQCRVAV